MTDEQINVAIAEACGWKRDKLGWQSPRGDYCDIPSYTTDLNAMNEAEKTLGADCEKYAGFLGIIVEADASRHEGWEHADTATMLYVFCHATARQRAEAFLKTKGLWR